MKLLKTVITITIVTGLLPEANLNQWAFIKNAQAEIESTTEQAEPTQDKLVIKADRMGHFRGNVIINGISMPFLIDTGATLTTIPVEMAKKAKLPTGQIRMMDTANGTTTAQETVIDKLQFDNALINNDTALINDKLNEVLIGMNTLKRFNLNIESDQITLSPRKGYTVETHHGVSKWKKSTVCNDEGKECKARYSQ